MEILLHFPWFNVTETGNTKRNYAKVNKAVSS